MFYIWPFVLSVRPPPQTYPDLSNSGKIGSQDQAAWWKYDLC